MIYAFLMAIGSGFVLGTLVGETKFGERAVMPLLVAVDTMPKVAFAPLFIAWLGFGISSKVALATFIATFPIVVSTAAPVSTPRPRTNGSCSRPWARRGFRPWSA